MTWVQTQFQFVNQERKPQTAISPVPIDDAFPEEQANKLAKLESYNKNLFRPNTYLHKWWARRSGTTFRFILKQLVPDTELRGYYAPGGLEGIAILDPMMGGGTTLHEAIRLGANVIGYDLDPIPVLQTRASLSGVPLNEKRVLFKRFLSWLEDKLRRYYGTHCPACGRLEELRFTLYGARKSCSCGEVLLVDSFLLREERNGQDTRVEQYYPALEVKRGDKRWRLLEKGSSQCEVCHHDWQDPTESHFPERYVPLLTVGVCKNHGLFFKAVDQYDLDTMNMARDAARRIALPPTESLRVLGGPKSRALLSRSIEYYSDLFTPRQLLYISAAREFLDDVAAEHRLWLALLLSTSLEFNSILCGYKGADKRRAGAIRHVFSHHAYSFPYTSLESNPIFSKRASGTLRRLFDDRISDAWKWARAPVERKGSPSGWHKVTIFGETDHGLQVSYVRDFEDKTKCFIVQQRDSSQMPLPDECMDFVVTDPPYFDSVQYSDLSHFFRVWLQWFLPEEADWSLRQGTSAVAENGGDGERYRSAMTAILTESNRVLRRPHGRLIFTFHHWRAEAWIQLTLALRDAGFRLVTSYTVHSENPISVHIRKLKALKHDSILVLQPRDLGPEVRRFAPVEAMDLADSFSFCRGCAQLLGFCLDNELQDSEIAALWESAVGN